MWRFSDVHGVGVSPIRITESLGASANLETITSYPSCDKIKESLEEVQRQLGFHLWEINSGSPTNAQRKVIPHQGASLGQVWTRNPKRKYPDGTQTRNQYIAAESLSLDRYATAICVYIGAAGNPDLFAPDFGSWPPWEVAAGAKRRVAEGDKAARTRRHSEDAEGKSRRTRTGLRIWRDRGLALGFRKWGG